MPLVGRKARGKKKHWINLAVALVRFHLGHHQTIRGSGAAVRRRRRPRADDVTTTGTVGRATPLKDLLPGFCPCYPSYATVSRVTAATQRSVLARRFPKSGVAARCVSRMRPRRTPAPPHTRLCCSQTAARRRVYTRGDRTHAHAAAVLGHPSQPAKLASARPRTNVQQTGFCSALSARDDSVLDARDIASLDRSGTSSRPKNQS